MGETIEQMCQRVLDVRKYLVIGRWDRVEPGTIIENLENNRTGLPPLVATLVIVSETNEADMLEQEEIMGYTAPNPGPANFYYRCMAE